MQTSGFQVAVALLVPILVAWVVWLLSRQAIRFGWLATGFVLGVAVVFPVVRLSNWVEAEIGDWTGHFYADELIRQILITAIPEEWGKGLISALTWRLMGKPMNPLSWVSCAATAHGGFAALEGLFGALGDEGLVKVLVGRSLGATLHCSWGITAAWAAWCGWQRKRFRIAIWGFALLFPAVLHAIGNASMVEVPGSPAIASDAPASAAELIIVLMGMASFVATWTLAGWCLYAARKTPSPPPIPLIP